MINLEGWVDGEGGGADHTEEVRIEPMFPDEQTGHPRISLTVGHEEKTFVVDAERLVRGVLATWEMVRPYPKVKP